MKLKRSQMKKIVILTIMLLVTFQTTLYAHSGRTDSRGGHKDNKNASGLGSYHYHCGGHPPHLHTNGICPYSSTSSSSSAVSFNSSKKSTSKNSYNSTSKTSSIAVTSVKIQTPTSSVMEIGENMNLLAEVNPSNSTDKSITWTSSNTNILTVTQNGLVNAVGDGEAVIYAKSNNGMEDTISIKVKAPTVEVTDIVLDTKSAMINSGDELNLKVNVYPENATNKSIIWSSSDESIAIIRDCRVIAVDEGEVTITAETENGIKSECRVTVIKDEEKKAGKVVQGENNGNSGDFALGVGVLGVAGVGSVVGLKHRKKKK